MSKTAVITGITGQDGALLSKYLLDKDYTVVGIDRRTSSPTNWRLKELGVTGNPKFSIASGDITDQGSIQNILQSVQPDEIYNLAAQSFVGSSWQIPVHTMDVTGTGALKVFDAAKHVCPEARIYQASSSEMFGGENRTETFDENSTFYPRSPYGVAKVAAHWSAINYRESYNMHVSCGILFNHESEYRGLEFVTRKVTDAVAKISLGKQEKLQLGNLDSVRDWGYAPDFVEAMWLMLQQERPDDYIIATGKTHNIAQLCEFAFSRVGIKNWRDYVELGPDRPADVKHLQGNYNKAFMQLGWSPKMGFKNMVAKMVDKDVERNSSENFTR